MISCFLVSKCLVARAIIFYNVNQWQHTTTSDSVELFPHHNVPRQFPPFSPIMRHQQVETFHRISERRRPQLEARLTLQTHPR